MRIPSGYLYYDTPIGILCLDTLFPKPPGQLRNPLPSISPLSAGSCAASGPKKSCPAPRRSSKRCSSTPPANLSGTGSEPSPEAAASWPCFRRPWPAPFPSPCSCPALSRSRSSIPCTARAAASGVAHRAFRFADARAFPAGGRSRRADRRLGHRGHGEFPGFPEDHSGRGRARHGHGRRGRGDRGRRGPAMTGRAAAGRPAARMHGPERIRPDRAGGGFRPGLRYQFPDRLRGLLRAAEPVGVTGNRPPQT